MVVKARFAGEGGEFMTVPGWCSCCWWRGRRRRAEEEREFEQHSASLLPLLPIGSGKGEGKRTTHSNKVRETNTRTHASHVSEQND